MHYAERLEFLEVALYFDEEESDLVLDRYSLGAEYEKSNIIVIGCSYYVYKAEEAWKTGEYDGWCVILTKEKDSGEWVIRDAGDKELL